MRETAPHAHTPQEWIAGLKRGDQQIVREFYEEERRPFLRWVRHRFHQDPASASDSYQETMLAFLGDARRGKLDVCTTYQRLRAYFFRLGRLIVRRAQVERARWVDLPPEMLDLPAEEEKNVEPERERKIVRAFRRLPPTYRQVLHLYYIEAKPLSEIVGRLNLKRPYEARLLLSQSRNALREAFRQA